MVQLGVITIHFKYSNLDDAELQQVGFSLFEVAEQAVREFIPVDSNVVLEVEQASIKVRSRILASATAVGLFLSHYGSVRQGAFDLSKDVYTVGDLIIRRVKDQLGVSSSEVISKRRSATFGRRTKSIFEQVERGRINSDEAMRQLLSVLDPDSEGVVPPEVIADVKKEIEAAHDQSKKISRLSETSEEPTAYVLWEERRPEIPREKLPHSLREKSLRPRRLRITREDGEIKIREVEQ